MALDAEYFDSIYIEVVKKKYYDADKVQAVFAEVREQAETLNAENESLRRRLAELEELPERVLALSAENESLRRQLAEIRDRKMELGDVLLSAQSIYQEIVERAEQKAAAITAAAEERAEAIEAGARRRSEQLLARSRGYEENAARRVEDAFARMKEIHQAAMDSLDARWQDFLCSLDPEAALEEPAGAAPDPAPAPEAESTQESEPRDDPGLPPDLEEKVGAIARGILSLEEDEE